VNKLQRVILIVSALMCLFFAFATTDGVDGNQWIGTITFLSAVVMFYLAARPITSNPQ